MDDLRSFINQLEEYDCLTRLSGVDPDLELGGLSKLVRRSDLRTSILFDDIEGHDEGFRLVSNTLDDTLQVCLALGYEPTTDLREAVLAHKEREPVTAAGELRTVSTGPVLENTLRGSDIDLTAFPAPKWHEHDGGKYIGTGDVVITRHRETGELNAGTYRMQVHGPETATLHISPGKDGAINRASFHDNDEPFPVVVSLGHAPDLFLGSNERLPGDVNELEYVSAQRERPLEVIEGEVTDLPIPSTSELVVEGHVYPDADPITEGPFGEWTGYYGSGERQVRPLEVERIYHREDPIVYGYNNVPITTTAMSVIRSASKLWEGLEESGIPGVQGVNSYMPGPWFQVVSIEQQYGGHSTQTGMAAISHPAGAYHGRFTVVVDDDIDVFDRDEVLWALTSRCDPETDIQIVSDCWSTPLDPRIPPDRKEEGDFTNSRAVIDATKPYHWIEEFPENSKISPELEKRLRDEWSELFDDES